MTPESSRYCQELFDSVRTGPLFTPPGLSLTLTFPGTLGGANWSGAAFDPVRHRLYVNVNEVGAVGGMQPAGPSAPLPYRRGSPWGEYARFWDENRWPCQQPPWGTLNAIDLDSGSTTWTVPLGVVDALVARGLPPTGTPSLGGAIATAGGLLFIGGTNDAHDVPRAQRPAVRSDRGRRGRLPEPHHVRRGGGLRAGGALTAL